MLCKKTRDCYIHSIADDNTKKNVYITTHAIAAQ